MKIFVACLCVLLTAASGCRDQGTGPSVSAHADAIRAAVFAYMFDNNESAQQNNTKVYFIGRKTVDDSQVLYADFDDVFMARFARRTPAVRRASECSTSPEGVFDKRTHERGLLFHVGTITTITAVRAEVEGGYFEGGLSASGNLYTVERINGTWKVIKDVLLWIS